MERLIHVDVFLTKYFFLPKYVDVFPSNSVLPSTAFVESLLSIKTAVFAASTQYSFVEILLHYGLILPLTKSIFLWSIWSCETALNSCFFTKQVDFFSCVCFAIVRPQGLNFTATLCFNPLLQFP